MKKALSALLTAMILLCCCLPAYADVDLTFIRENPESFEIDTEYGNAFISTTIPKNGMIFDHKYSLRRYPSFLYTDIIITGYDTPLASAAWRVWFYYRADDFLDIRSVTITMDGTDYTFYVMNGIEYTSIHNMYLEETPLIIMGACNHAFWEKLILEYDKAESLEDFNSMAFPMVLHGWEDIETQISGTAILDMCLMGEAFIRIAGVQAFDGIEGTELTVVNH